MSAKRSKPLAPLLALARSALRPPRSLHRHGPPRTLGALALRAALVLLLLLASLAAPLPAPFGSSVAHAAPGDENWDARFTPPGMNGSVLAAALDAGSGNLYVSGSFTTAGRVSTNYIARWNGSTWLPLGSGMNGSVRALAFDAGSGRLYAGGSFGMAGDVTASRIAQWDGNAWSPLRSGIDGHVYALAVDGSGNLYAGGSFGGTGGMSAYNIAKWTPNAQEPGGGTWSRLGDGTNGQVNALAVDSSGNLYVGGPFNVVGNFTTGGGVPANNIAKWTPNAQEPGGGTWSSLGYGANGGTVNALAVDGSGNLYAGGAFSIVSNKVGSAGVNVPANYIAKWTPDSENANTGVWSALGSGMNHYVSALAVDGSGNLYAGGSFGAVYNTTGGLSANYIAKWTPNAQNPSTGAWSALGSGMNHYVYALAVEGSGSLYAGGTFSVAYNTTGSTIVVNYIAKWTPNAQNPNTGAWSALGNGVNSTIRALAFDAGSGSLYAGGDFGMAGSVTASHIARWDGSAWSPLGSGINGSVYALAVDGSGNLYAGGSFSTAGGMNAYNIARWTPDPQHPNGGTWSALGGGTNGGVVALAVDNSGNLYVGGYFSAAYNTTGGLSSNYIAKWTPNAQNP